MKISKLTEDLFQIEENFADFNFEDTQCILSIYQNKEEVFSYIFNISNFDNEIDSLKNIIKIHNIEKIISRSKKHKELILKILKNNLID